MTCCQRCMKWCVCGGQFSGFVVAGLDAAQGGLVGWRAGPVCLAPRRPAAWLAGYFGALWRVAATLRHRVPRTCNMMSG